jgi:hypothetical protein
VQAMVVLGMRSAVGIGEQLPSANSGYPGKRTSAKNGSKGI